MDISTMINTIFEFNIFYFIFLGLSQQNTQIIQI